MLNSGAWDDPRFPSLFSPISPSQVFGSSVLEMARIFTQVFLHFFQNPEDYSRVEGKLNAASLPVSERKWSHYIGGLDVLCSHVDGIRKLAMKRCDDRHKAFVTAHSVEDYTRENAREWRELHSILGVWSQETSYLPYPKWSSSKKTGA